MNQAQHSQWEGNMIKFLVRSSLAAALASGSAAAAAQSLIVYPASGQSKEQQMADEGECFAWAKDNTGIDPMAQQAPPPQQAPKGGLGRGALRGAAIGGIVDGSDGAKTGAAVGATIGGIRRADQNRQQAAQQQQYQQSEAAKRDTFNRAYTACLTGRGYSVQ